MDTSNFRPESHIAQQSRREKLRFPQNSGTPEDFHNNLEQLSVHHLGLNPNLVQVRGVRNGNLIYDPSVLSPDMINFATSSNVLSSHHEPGQELAVVQPHKHVPSGDASLANMSHPILSNFNVSPKASNGDPQGCGTNWRNLDSHQSYDWMVNYASGSIGSESNQKLMFVGEVLSNNSRVSNISTPTQYLKPSHNGYQDVQFPSSEVSRQVVTSSSPFAGSEHVLLPAYANQSTAFHLDSSSNGWVNRPALENCHQYLGDLDIIARKGNNLLTTNATTDANSQGLSLSLSSNPPIKPNTTQSGDGYECDILPSKAGHVFKEPPQDSKFAKFNYSCQLPKPSIIRKGFEKSLQDIVGATTTTHVVRSSTGPLGPFTGYSTILKSSRFLRPAQELLEEFLGSKLIKTTSEMSERMSGEVSASASVDAINAADAEAGAKGDDNNSFLSTSTFYSSNDQGCGDGGGDGVVRSSTCESHRPEYQQMKAKLLFLQEEVYRRYKQYHHQMQMVASSFESVSGLSTAAPYVFLALKTVSRNFRCLKLSISNQLKHVTKALGEDLLSTSGSGSKGEAGLSMVFQKHKPGGANVGFIEPQTHVWRPQRGLPERSVAILRAWLFDHFLHPYPTDTDKHMLATQTGLSRNQVSNWFINARVRVWKPMVEEIHMLETKALAETNQSAGRSDTKSAEGTSQLNPMPPSCNVTTNSLLNKQLDSSGFDASAGSREELDSEPCNQEKRSRVEFQVPASMDGTVMNFLPYQRGGLDIGGLGAVTLTLGLRHGVENAQHQHHQQQMQQHDQLRRRFGGQMIHDFVG